jgi:glutaredoxin 3
MVTIYTTTFCGYCMQAKALLKQRGIPFKEILISYDDDQIWDDLYKRSGMRTVPQIFHDEKVVGGFFELATLDRQDQLTSLIK